MTDKTTITEIEDKPGVVYLIGVPPTANESVRDWYYTEFEHLWAKKFDNAEVLTVPGPADGDLEIIEADQDELKEMLTDD